MLLATLFGLVLLQATTKIEFNAIELLRPGAKVNVVIIKETGRVILEGHIDSETNPSFGAFKDSYWYGELKVSFISHFFLGFFSTWELGVRGKPNG